MFGQSLSKRQGPAYAPQVGKARIERVIFASQNRGNGRNAVEKAQKLLLETMAIVSAIETRLEKLLAVVERATVDRQPNRLEHLAEEFEAICAQIDELTALCSGRGSLIDSSGFALSIEVGVHGHSKIKVPHVNLTSGPQGLDLRGQMDAMLRNQSHDVALAAVQHAFVTLDRVQRAYGSTSRWLEAA